LKDLYDLKNKNFYIQGDSDYENGLFNKFSEEQNQYDSYIYNQAIKEGNWEFKLKIEEYDNTNKSLLVGFTKSNIEYNHYDEISKNGLFVNSSGDILVPTAVNNNKPIDKVSNLKSSFFKDCIITIKLNWNTQVIS